MAQVQISEDWIPTKIDKFPIYHRTWKSVGEVKATVVFVHGFGEHCARYDHVFIPFAREGFEVYSYDSRGFGRSAQRSKYPGLTLGYQVVLRDLDEVITRVRLPNVPLFLYGHSMGGAIALTYGIKGPQRRQLAGVIVSSPLLKPVSAPHALVIGLGKAIAKFLPWLTIPISLDTKFISRDPAEVEKYVKDPLVHNTGTLLGSGDMLTAGELLLSTLYADWPADLPYLLTHGTNDMITSYEASKQFHEKATHVQDRTFLPWDGLYHELHNEPEKEEVIQTYISWIKARLNNKPNIAKTAARL